MRLEWYRQRNGKLFAGILASIANQFSWKVSYVRAIFLILLCLPHIGGIVCGIYILLYIFLPYKEDIYAERYGTGPRKRKEAQKIRKK